MACVEMASSRASSTQGNSNFVQISSNSGHKQESPSSNLKPDWLQSKDASKRKRVNRIAKLKQCKLDARREQWLSQGSCGRANHVDREKDERWTHTGNSEKSTATLRGLVLPCNPDGGFGSQPLKTGQHVHFDGCGGKSSITRDADAYEEMDLRCQKNRQPEVQDLICTRNSWIDRGNWSSTLQHGIVPVETHDVKTMQKTSNTDELCVSSLDVQLNSESSSAESNVVSSIGFINQGAEADTQESDPHRFVKSMQQLSLIKSQSQGPLCDSDTGDTQSCCTHRASSGYVGSSSKDARYHDGEDDWETVADAMYVQNAMFKSGHNDELEYGNDGDMLDITPNHPAARDIRTGAFKAEYKFKAGGVGGRSKSTDGRAWRPDDAARPPTLPRLTKQHSFPLIPTPRAWVDVPERNSWGQASAPLFCPICTEELDLTDSSFVPCSCGFRLCLFCHHRIASDDGRCPGCRQVYNSDAVVDLSHNNTGIWLRI